tara:strand:- start:2 stop:238 length:237 start_codon:yes stop_codon:yes gene_type:complete
MVKNYQNLIKEITVLAKQELDFCNSNDTPYLCEFIAISPENKEQILQQVIELVGKRSLTISQTLVELENQLNPNYTLN